MTQCAPLKKELSKEEIDRLFEKQGECEERNEESARRAAEDWYRSEWLRKRTNHEFPNDLLSRDKRWRQDGRSRIAGARFEARQIPKRLQQLKVKKYREILKQGVLEGVIQIHETPDGFEIDTSPEKMAEYFSRRHPRLRRALPKPSDLVEGRILLGTFHDLTRKRVKLVRRSLMKEFGAERPSDIMLIDLAVSNYFRCMYATELEMDCLWHADDYSVEMFEVMSEGLHPYIHSCQNQLLRVLRALETREQSQQPASVFSQETHTKTQINLTRWGPALLLALDEVTENNGDEIGLDEIKQVMARIGGLDAEVISNSLIGYALRYYGFNDKVHTSDGNRYKINREKVLMLLANEGLKA